MSVLTWHVFVNQCLQIWACSDCGKDKTHHKGILNIQKGPNASSEYIKFSDFNSPLAPWLHFQSWQQFSFFLFFFFAPCGEPWSELYSQWTSPSLGPSVLDSGGLASSVFDLPKAHKISLQKVESVHGHSIFFVSLTEDWEVTWMSDKVFLSLKTLQTDQQNQLCGITEHASRLSLALLDPVILKWSHWSKRTSEYGLSGQAIYYQGNHWVYMTTVRQASQFNGGREVLVAGLTSVCVKVLYIKCSLFLAHSLSCVFPVLLLERLTWTLKVFNNNMNYKT